MTSASDRNERISRLFRIARQKYHPVAMPPDRTVLEHLIYGCLLEDSTFMAADETFARLQLDYVDWNEVRVTTPVELAGVMKALTDPEQAALRLRRCLHGLFEAHYSWDLEFLRKENLGKAMEQVARYRGMTPFGIAWVSQQALGGHAIPVDQSLMSLMVTLGIVDPSEAATMKVTGMERVIPKNQGIEFGSVVHQLAVAWRQAPFNNDLRTLLKKIAPDSDQRFPKRGGTRTPEKVTKPAPPAPTARNAAKPGSGPGTRPAPSGTGDQTKKKPDTRPPAPRKIAAKPPAKSVKPDRPATPARPAASRKPAGNRPPAAPKKPAPARKGSSSGLARKKPR